MNNCIIISLRGLNNKANHDLTLLLATKDETSHILSGLVPYIRLKIKKIFGRLFLKVSEIYSVLSRLENPDVV